MWKVLAVLAVVTVGCSEDPYDRAVRCWMNLEQAQVCVERYANVDACRAGKTQDVDQEIKQGVDQKLTTEQLRARSRARRDCAVSPLPCIKYGRDGWSAKKRAEEKVCALFLERYTTGQE